MTSTTVSPEMALIRDSCDSASARIRFFRVAFGSAEPHQLVSRREIAATLDGICKGGRTMAVWEPMQDQPRGLVQLLYLSFLCCESALPQGGTVRISEEEGLWLIEATAPKLKIEPEVWDLLDGAEHENLVADKVHFALLAMQAKTLGKNLRTAAKDGVVSISIL